MDGYRRPPLPTAVHLDDEGRPIEYGRRWHGGPPPDDAYSRTRDLDRFGGLHLVADALIVWLGSTFDVEVADSPELAAQLRHRPDVVRAVRLDPRARHAAPLTFAFTSFPGVILHAGAAHEFAFPFCGCDACDEDVVSMVEELEWTVSTIVSGGYSESRSAGADPWTGYRLEEPGAGVRSGSARASDLPPSGMILGREHLPPDGRWLAWPLPSPAATP